MMTSEIKLDQKTFLKKVPTTWYGLFRAAMNSADEQLKRMQAWYLEETSSKYGSSLSWNELIAYLLMEDPAIVGEDLIFRTRFNQLPSCLQQAILSFLLHHRHSIPRSCLKSFVEGITPVMTSDTWIGILHRMMNTYVQSCSTDESTVSHSQYEFSKENKQLCESLQQKLKARKPINSPWTISAQFSRDKMDILEDASKDDVRVMSPDMRDVSPDIIMIEEEDLPPSKIPKLVPGVFNLTQIDQSQNVSVVENESSIEILLEDLERMKALKDRWENGDEMEVPNEIEILLSSSTNMVERLCEEINMAGLTEVAMTTACRNLVQKEKLISHGNCKVVLAALFSQKLQHLSQSASRSLTGVITMVAGTFAKPLVDGVFTSCIQSDEFNTFQADLIVKVCKDVFHNTDRIYFLEGMLKVPIEMNDSLISVLNSLFDNKLDINNSLLTSVLELLNAHGNTMAKNLKFGKLVLAIINKYGMQITAEQKDLLSQILMSHRSFLKKSIQTAMSKLTC